MRYIFLTALHLSLFIGVSLQAKPDLEVSLLALKKILYVNPYIEPADERDAKKKFTDLVADYLNPGIFTIFDDSTGSSLTHFSYTTNTCDVFNEEATFSVYNCEYTTGYSKAVKVDELGKVELDLGLLNSSGISILYDLKLKSDDSAAEFSNTAYYIF